MKAIILAAGMGNRLGERTRDLPKALVTVAGKPLLEYVLDFLDTPVISEVGIVTGYQAQVFEKFVREKYPKIRLFHNPQYREGSILTLKAARDFLDDDFLLCNADHIYPRHLFDCLKLPRQNLSAICDFDRTLVEDDMKVSLDKSRHITRIDKKLATYQAGYIGMTFCPKACLPDYWAGAEEALSDRGSKACVEAILDTLAPKMPIEILDASGFGWLEVDNEEDLQKAESRLESHT